MKAIRLLGLCLAGFSAVLSLTLGPVAALDILPGELCAADGPIPASPEGRPGWTDPRQHWTEPEKWVWERVCKGEKADFNERYAVELPLDPKSPDGWATNRALSGAFLKTILLDEPFRSAITHRGVRIIGAWFRNSVNLAHGTLDHELWLNHSRFDSSVQLSALKTTDLINLDGSKFTGKLTMDSTEVGGDLFMRGGAEFAEVDLRGARIGDQFSMTGSKFTDNLNMDSIEVGSTLFLSSDAEFGDAEFGAVRLAGAKIGNTLSMIGSKFSGELSMDSIEVGGHLFMSGRAEFAEVDLRSARVGDQLAVDGSKFTGKLTMDSMEVGGDLFMRGGAEFAEVVLRGARIGDQLAMIGSKFTGKLSMDSMEVGGDLFMRGSEFAKPVPLYFSKIGSNLDISGANLASLDLTGTRIGGELRLGSPKHDATKWKDGSRLTLRNTVVGALQDRPDAWPETLELEGFAYSRLGGFGAGATEMADREVQWFIDWLEKGEDYSPQPYEQLATVLRKAGRYDTANDVLYAGRERERDGTTGIRWWGLTSLNYLIGYGYGYRYFYSLFWIVGVVGLGVGVLRLTGEHRKHAIPLGVAYSLDMLLPIIKLRETHYDIDLDGRWRGARWYFYVHKMAGYVLASFLIAGLSGLTK